MANEATLHVATGLPVKFTVSNTTGIEKGTILQLTDPWTASAQSGANQAVAGIANSEKIASDGVTTLDVHTQGIFRVTLSGACTVGASLVTDAALNHVKQAPISSSVSGANIIGRALETGADGETIFMELRPSRVDFSTVA